jgi:hypothetical protein
MSGLTSLIQLIGNCTKYYVLLLLLLRVLIRIRMRVESQLTITIKTIYKRYNKY